MTEQTPAQVTQAETLSALMDNQASELELLRLLKASEHQDELRQRWSRYQLASAALRNELPLLAAGDFASRVSAAIADEPVYAAAAAKSELTAAAKRNWWQQLGKVAVAASVASAMVVGVQQYQAGQVTSGDLLASQAAPAAPAVATPNLPSGINAPALSARTVAVQSGYELRPQESRRVLFVPRQEASPVYNEEVSSYVNQLIEEHSGNAALNSGQGMLPFTRVILTEEE